MELKIYLDVSGWETQPSHFFPFTGNREKTAQGKRYCFTVEIPDPMSPDIVIDGVELVEEVER